MRFSLPLLLAAVTGVWAESLVGDTKCALSLCISAIVNSNSTTTYILQSTGKLKLGWMAMGFGSQMPNTPMVIMWSNSDNSITLSQRQAPAEIMPTLVSNPPRLATPVASLSDPQSSSNPKFAFNIPSNSDADQHIIYSFSTTHPGSPDKGAMLVQHTDRGTLTLNLKGSAASFNPANPSASAGGSNSSPPSSSSPGGSTSLPFRTYEKYIIAHATLSAFGFMVLLPLGALVGRLLRLVIPTKWFEIHASIQFLLAFPIIITGFGLAIRAVQLQHAIHFSSRHGALGLTLVLFYLVLQLPAGMIVHCTKNPARIGSGRRGRPLRNYAHGAFGLLIISLAFWQVWLGFNRQWNMSTGRGNAPRGVWIAWLVWMVILCVAYISGLLLLRRQFRLEDERRESMERVEKKQ